MAGGGVRERLTVPAPGPSSERSGGGLPGEITHFTGRDEPMAELRTRIAEQAPQGTVVSIYAIDGMAGVGKTAFARHAAQELAERYPDGAIWVDLYGHTPGMQPRPPSGALEQMLLQLGVPLSDEQRRAFRLLGWHPGPAITPVVIAAVADVAPAQGKQLLRELVDHNLLEQLSIAGVPGGPRYRIHDLVRLYARERADAEELPGERAAAVDRLAGSYLAITHEVDRLLRPYVADDPGKNTAQTVVLAFAGAPQARSWLTVERHNLLGVVRAMSPTAEAADLSTVLACHFCDFGFSSDVRYLFGQALALARHLGHRRAEAGALSGLGHVASDTADRGQARELWRRALEINEELGVPAAETVRAAMCQLDC